MRRLSSLVLVAAIALVGYNYYQVSRLREDLRLISRKISAQGAGRESHKGGSLLVVLAKARDHSERARSLLARGRYRQARDELDKGLSMIERASELSRDLRADAESGLGRMWKRVRDEADKGWRDIVSEVKKRRRD